MHLPLFPIRPVSNEDGPALARLIAQCFAEYDGCLYAAHEFPELAAPADHYGARGAVFQVMVLGEEVVGSLAVSPVRHQSLCDISKVYLAAAHRGNGAAQALMARAEQAAMQIGLPDLALWTDTRFTRAHRFYEKLGFTRQPVTRYLADVSLSWEYRYERRGAHRT